MSSWVGKPQTLMNESNKVEIMSCLVMLTLLQNIILVQTLYVFAYVCKHAAVYLSVFFAEKNQESKNPQRHWYSWHDVRVIFSRSLTCTHTHTDKEREHVVYHAQVTSACLYTNYGRIEIAPWNSSSVTAGLKSRSQRNTLGQLLKD